MYSIRFLVILAVIATAVILLWPTYQWYYVLTDNDRNLLNLSSEEVDRLPKELKQRYVEVKKIRNSTVLNLGLDLRGGIYLTLEPDPEDMTNYLLNKYEGDIQKVVSEFEKEYAEQIDIALQVLRNRLDQFGVAEPVIRKERGNRISIELPGLSSSVQAKDAISRAGKLEFKLVDEDFMKSIDRKFFNSRGLISDINEVLSNYSLPEDSEILGYYEASEVGFPRLVGYIVLKKEVSLDGSFISSVRPDSDQYGNPAVAFSLTPEGADIFANVTRENVGRRLAIVLDGKVRSAPNIQTEIVGGRGQITGSFTPEEVSTLVSILKSGALNVKLKEIETRVIGPSLGADSIKYGSQAALIGILLVFAFALFYYKTFGIFTSISLVLNLFLLIASLAAIRATLTLPGIAGIALTIGMAIDANVLQFERIKEELRNGKDLLDAIKVGFERSFVTIIDSHITVIIAAFILSQYGYGPIKGFGTTLLLGIIISLFTSVFVVRFFVDFLVDKLKIRNVKVLV